MDLLQRWGKNDPEILEESLEAASHEANRMTIMINDMLDSCLLYTSPCKSIAQVFFNGPSCHSISHDYSSESVCG